MSATINTKNKGSAWKPHDSAVNLESSQLVLVYYTEENALQSGTRAKKTKLVEFFTLCQKCDVLS